MTTLRNLAALVALAVCFVLPGAAGAQEPPADPDPGLFPTADFTALPTSGTAPLDVEFTDRSVAGALGDGEIDSWAWDFDGDGTVDSTVERPTHRYEAPGAYTVTLTVTDGLLSDAETKTDYVTVEEPPNEPPTAVASAEPQSGTAPLLVEFDGTGSSDDSNDLLTYAWDFGVAGDDDTSTSATPEFTYTTPGTYTATLTVTDEDGAQSDPATVVITVTNPPNVVPVAAFDADALAGTAPFSVAFTDKSTDGDGQLTSWAWDFGDGTTSDQQSPEHEFTKPGQHVVTLRVTDDDGATSAPMTRTVVVNARPSASFTASSLTGPAPFEPTFTSTSSDPDGSIASHAWDFGDGATGSGATASHRYAAVGTYQVTLTVTDDDGARATSTQTVTVTLAPEVIEDSPAGPTLQKVLTDLLERTPGPCSVRMLTDSALVVCGGNKPSALGLRISAVNAGAAPVAGTVSGVETIPAKGRRVRAAAKRKKARYPTVRRVTPAFGSTSFVLKPPKKLRRALKVALERRGRVARKPVVTLRAGGVTARMPHAVTARKKKKRR